MAGMSASSHISLNSEYILRKASPSSLLSRRTDAAERSGSVWNTSALPSLWLCPAAINDSDSGQFPTHMYNLLIGIRYGILSRIHWSSEKSPPRTFPPTAVGLCRHRSRGV